MKDNIPHWNPIKPIIINNLFRELKARILPINYQLNKLTNYKESIHKSNSQPVKLLSKPLINKITPILFIELNKLPLILISKKAPLYKEVQTYRKSQAQSENIICLIYLLRHKMFMKVNITLKNNFMVMELIILEGVILNTKDNFLMDSFMVLAL